MMKTHTDAYLTTMVSLLEYMDKSQIIKDTPIKTEYPIKEPQIACIKESQKTKFIDSSIQTPHDDIPYAPRHPTSFQSKKMRSHLRLFFQVSLN
ncbi:hypothetical protein AKO1_007816 [Acrasis kona]|uniref:Uncharacterized protein n=1 Tax=Acrasis kona TaxID=1008807 RepID=A0AAW2YP53_9EUKA